MMRQTYQFILFINIIRKPFRYYYLCFLTKCKLKTTSQLLIALMTKIIKLPFGNSTKTGKYQSCIGSSTCTVTRNNMYTLPYLFYRNKIYFRINQYTHSCRQLQFESVSLADSDYITLQQNYQSMNLLNNNSIETSLIICINNRSIRNVKYYMMYDFILSRLMYIGKAGYLSC